MLEVDTQRSIKEVTRSHYHYRSAQLLYAAHAEAKVTLRDTRGV
jgi:hypothetical protein